MWYACENKKAVLVYRNNKFWGSIAADLVKWVEKITQCEELNIKIFPEETSVEEIATWAKDNPSVVAGAAVFADGTTARCLGSDVDIYELTLDLLGGMHFAERFFEGQPIEIYREIFNRIVEQSAIQKITVVLDSIGDYNPLHLVWFRDDDQATSEMLVAYARAFADLIPGAVEIEVVNTADSLAEPGPNELILVHHHALYKARRGELEKSSRVLMPYASGFWKKARKLADLSDLASSEDMTDVIRAILREN
jgi:hypothetical protein